jgi:hypothetical protein
MGTNGPRKMHVTVPGKKINTKFTCFTSTKVQILTAEEVRGRNNGSGRARQVAAYQHSGLHDLQTGFPFFLCDFLKKKLRVFI